MSGSTPRTGSAARPAASVAFLDKPDGLSSFAALGALKRVVGTRKVGHTGTLDPFATGLLVALVGSATRAARYFNGLPKRYSARFVFGSQTDTDDATGTVTRSAEPPTADSLARALPRFRGSITQLPPAYSAVHVGGRRAHEIARSGDTPILREREVTVTRMEVVATEEEGGLVEYADVDIACSAGTYVRSIARDLGLATGSAAHVSVLRRTEVGPFTVEGALQPDEITPDALYDLAPVLARLPGFVSLEIPEAIAGRVAHGKELTTADLSAAAPLAAAPSAAPPGTGKGRTPDGGTADPGTADPDRPPGPADEAEPRRIVLTHGGVTRAIGRFDGHRFIYEMVVPQGGSG